jgi:hypothetical protein
MNSHFIIGGGFNAKHTHWGSRLITTKGHELYKAVADTGYEIVSTNVLAQRENIKDPKIIANVFNEYCTNITQKNLK